MRCSHIHMQFKLNKVLSKGAKVLKDEFTSIHFSTSIEIILDFLLTSEEKMD